MTVYAAYIRKYSSKTGQYTGISITRVDVQTKLNIAANVTFFQSLNSFLTTINEHNKPLS